MKEGYMIVISHPDLSEVFVMRKIKLDSFIERNTKLWKKYNIDYKKFQIQDAWLKDQELQDLLSKEFPEDLL